MTRTELISAMQQLIDAGVQRQEIAAGAGIQRSLVTRILNRTRWLRGDPHERLVAYLRKELARQARIKKAR